MTFIEIDYDEELSYVRNYFNYFIWSLLVVPFEFYAQMYKPYKLKKRMDAFMKSRGGHQ